MAKNEFEEGLGGTAGALRDTFVFEVEDFIVLEEFKFKFEFGFEFELGLELELELVFDVLFAGVLLFLLTLGAVFEGVLELVEAGWAGTELGVLEMEGGRDCPWAAVGL